MITITIKFKGMNFTLFPNCRNLCLQCLISFICQLYTKPPRTFENINDLLHCDNDNKWIKLCLLNILLLLCSMIPWDHTSTAAMHISSSIIIVDYNKKVIVSYNNDGNRNAWQLKSHAMSGGFTKVFSKNTNCVR